MNKLVPVAPTAEMIEAICATSTAAKWPDDFGDSARTLRRELARKAWSNALDVSPTPSDASTPPLAWMFDSEGGRVISSDCTWVEHIYSEAGIGPLIPLFGDMKTNTNRQRKLRRSIEVWRKCDPNAMAKMSEAAIMFAFNDLLHDVLELSK